MTEKKKSTRTKKDVVVTIDTPKIDVSIEKTAEGNFHAELDTERVDVQIDKTEKTLNINVEIDDKIVYEFESNGKSKHMGKGQVFKIVGKLAKYFIERGFGRIKK